MPKQWCCQNSEHPNDWFCMYVWTRPACPIPPPPPMPPLGEGPGGNAGIGETRYASSEHLVSLDKKLNEMPNSPTPSDLVALADALRVEDFAEDAIGVAQHLEENARIDPKPKNPSALSAQRFEHSATAVDKFTHEDCRPKI